MPPLMQFSLYRLIFWLEFDEISPCGGKRQAPIFKRRFGSNGNRFRACCGWLAISLPPRFSRRRRFVITSLPPLKPVVIRVIQDNCRIFHQEWGIFIESWNYFHLLWNIFCYGRPPRKWTNRKMGWKIQIDWKEKRLFNF